ncbi:hypothetical protein E3N88_21539 [Mikania micrantha]|uniref:START domain-containing protein n=1 Tax=Mikania micrantha TaxID=192012 RepID=A0A5N6NK46_9ASTR|nr:hypothetical protein E3N88_21539 [Mikania micrantha]
MDNLDETGHEKEKWESVVDRRNNSLSYSVKCCKPKDGGPVKYSSTTTFNLCSCETLRDFYMDNFYRKEWDKTLIDHEQLQVDESNGTEIGRTIKKFPLLTPREYILAWRLWEGRDRTYYCYSKECEHHLAPRQKKYVRVGLLRSGWRIREGKNSCQIKMVHQEDAGLNVEMAKMIFAKGIWSYVCKMDNALRKYSAIKRIQLNSIASAITFVQKVPLLLDSTSEMTAIDHPEVSEEGNQKKVSGKSSKKLIANGLIIVGGVICLTRGHTNFSAKIAMAYILMSIDKRLDDFVIVYLMHYTYKKHKMELGSRVLIKYTLQNWALETEFESLKMNEAESIQNFAYWISAIVSKANSLGAAYKDKKLVRRLLEAIGMLRTFEERIKVEIPKDVRVINYYSSTKATNQKRVDQKGSDRGHDFNRGDNRCRGRDQGCLNGWGKDIDHGQNSNQQHK